MRLVRTLLALGLSASLVLGLLALPAAAVSPDLSEPAEAVQVSEAPEASPEPAEIEPAAEALPEGAVVSPAETSDRDEAAAETPDQEETEAPAEAPGAETPEASAPAAPADTPPALTAGHPVYVQGFPDGTFRPGEMLTRAQAAQMVDRLLADPAGGKGASDFTDVPAGQWYTQAVRDLAAWGLVDAGGTFRPNGRMTRGDFTALLVRLHPEAAGTARFSDVPPSHPAYDAIGAAAALGWVTGFPDGTFRPDQGLTRAEAVTMLNRAAGRTGDADQAGKLLTLGLFPDVGPGHWAGTAILEAAVAHTPMGSETWVGLDYQSMTFTPGFHQWKKGLFYADRNGRLAVSRTLGAYTARADGSLTWETLSYATPYVPYMSQIDNIYAWVGCEAVAALPGLQTKGFARNVTLRYFLDNLPRSRSDPEKGFVGSPYVPDRTKRTRTTIYPAKLAEYCNSFCGGQTPCADFRGASVTDLQRELLAGNLVVGYLTLWWNAPQYRAYNIEGRTQWLVSNNHAVLIYGYDPVKGYLISDPYNYYNRGQVYQYWENKATFEKIWNERKVGMVIR